MKSSGWKVRFAALAILAALTAAIIIRPLSPVRGRLLEAHAEEVRDWSVVARWVGSAAEAQVPWLSSEEAVSDETRLIDTCGRLAAAVETLRLDLRRRAEASGNGRSFHEAVRGRLLESRDIHPLFPAPVVPIRSFLLSAPATRQPDAERGLENALQALRRLLGRFPPGSPPYQAIQEAIQKILALLGDLDAAPIVVTFTAPAEDTIANTVPAIRFDMVDDRSGPDPASRQLVAAIPGSPEVDLTSFTSVVFPDADGLRAVVSAAGVPESAIPDGFVTLTASGTDRAGNPRSTATLHFVLDRLPPEITVPLPAPGSSTAESAPSLSASWTDSTSGVALSTARVSLDGADVTGASALTDGGFAFVPPPLAPGGHSVTVAIADLAGNGPAVLTWTFTVARPPPAPSILTPAPGAYLTHALPAVTGASSEAGLTITLLVDGSGGGSATSGAGGAWSLVPAAPLAEGAHVLTAFASSAAGDSPLSNAVGVTVDTAPPGISNPLPAPGSTIPSATPGLSASWSDATSGVIPGSAEISLDGVNITASAVVTDSGFTASPAPLAPGSHAVTVRVFDAAGHLAVLSWSFLVEAAPPAETTLPVVADPLPAPGALTNARRPLFRASLSDAGGSGLSASGATLTLNGISLPLTLTFQDPDHASVELSPGFDLPEGVNAVSFDVQDRAGNTGSLSMVFTIDASPPSILVTAPAAGTTLNSTSVVLTARVEDALAGVSVGGVSVLLNGAPQAVNVLPGPAGAFGAPLRVDLSGVLAGSEGDLVLTVRASDLAGNGAEAVVAFRIDAPDPPPGDAFLLSVVSGDGQEGLAGRKLENDLVVRVTRVSDGAPAVGVQIHFNGKKNPGVFGRSSSGGLITNAGGQAAVRYALSSLPGENVVVAAISGSPDAAPVEFRATGKLPSIAENFLLDPCNVMGGVTQEYPGSAIPRLIRARARKPDGSPLKGEIVRPFVADHNGLPPAGPVGAFLPSRATTDDKGEALFAFVIDVAAAAGPFTLRFGLPEFRDADAKEVSFDLAGAVRDPANKRFFGSVEINFDDLARTGQSQIGIPNRDLALELRGRIVEGARRPLRFVILEGAGTLSPGSEGSPWEPVVQACGQVSFVMDTQEQGNDGIASIKFRLAEGHTHALITMEGWSDIWAVGPPEAGFVGDGPGGYVGLPNVAPTSTAEADPAAAYRVLARVPKGTTPTARLRSVNAFDEEPASIEHGVAATSIPSLALSRDGGASRPEYDVFVSGPVASTDDLVPPEETPSGGGGPIAFLGTTPFGGAMATVTVAAQDTSIKVRNTQFLKSSSSPDRRGLIFDKTVGPYDPAPVPTLLKFSFALGDARTFKSAEWDLDGDGGFDKTTEKAEIFATYGTAKNVAPAGAEGSPVTLAVAEETANRRKNILLKARVTYVDDQGAEKSDLVLSSLLRLALNSPVPGGATAAAPKKSQAGLTTVADWTAAPPKNSSNLAFTFADPANAPDGVKAAITDAGANLAANRLAYGTTFTGLATSFRNVDPAKFELYGAAIGSEAFVYDLEVLSNTIDHEAKHLRAASDAQTLNTPFKILCKHVFQAFDEPEKVAEVYMETFDHSDIELDDLLDPRASYRHINDRNTQSRGGGPGGEIHFVLSFNAMEQTLLEGKDFAMVSQRTRLRPTLRALALPEPGLSAMRTRLNFIYKRAIRKDRFPELQLKDEFLEAGQLIRPPAN